MNRMMSMIVLMVLFVLLQVPLLLLLLLLLLPILSVMIIMIITVLIIMTYCFNHCICYTNYHNNNAEHIKHTWHSSIMIVAGTCTNGLATSRVVPNLFYSVNSDHYIIISMAPFSV